MNITEYSNIPFKIYKFVADTAGVYRANYYPGKIDYKKDLIIRLADQKFWSKGLLTKVEYYEEYNQDTEEYNNIILEVIQDYVYAPDGISYRDKNWYYYLEDGTKKWVKGSNGDPAKFKYYNSAQDKRKEGRRRRQNVLDYGEMAIVGMLVQAQIYDLPNAIAQGMAFNATYNGERDSYIKDNTETFKQAILADTTYSWLDTDIGGGLTIRNWISGELTFP